MRRGIRRRRRRRGRTPPPVRWCLFRLPERTLPVRRSAFRRRRTASAVRTAASRPRRRTVRPDGRRPPRSDSCPKCGGRNAVSEVARGGSLRKAGCGVSLRSVCRVGGTECAECAGLRRRGCMDCRLCRTAVRRPRRSERARYAAGCGKPRRVVTERVPGRRHGVRGMRRIAAQGVQGVPGVPDGGAAMLDEVRRPARTVGATEERTDEAYCRMRRHGTGQARTAN